ncbi:MAG: methyltransferase family protein [Oceanobacter sp.]
MKWLELKVPPPGVAILVAASMWSATGIPAGITERPITVQIAFGLLVLVAGLLDGTGVLNFLRHHTTINPMAPEKSSELVTDGPYRFTRNPMYLGLALLLTALTLYLGNPFALLGPIVFLAYITRFQILPEEQFLLQKFGSSYEDYKSKVRRWI